MEKRKFVNPILHDSAYFLKTAKETNGEFTLLEIELEKSDGPPLHYHKTFSETFQAVQGTLHIQAGRQEITLNPGESYTVPPRLPHRFFNPSDETLKFRVTLQPGHSGMENFIKIFYGLAADGLTDQKGKPKHFAHLAVALVISDSNAPGMMSLLSPIIRMMALRARRNGTEKWLLQKYCT